MSRLEEIINEYQENCENYQEPFHMPSLMPEMDWLDEEDC